MKKIFVILSVMALAAGFLFAQGFDDSTDAFGQGQGFIDDGSYSDVLPIKNVLKMRDDATATIRGKIVKRLSDDKYLFKDATGQIIVEIDYEDWCGVTASPKDTLELSGEVDRDFNKIKLDVFSVKKLD